MSTGAMPARRRDALLPGLLLLDLGSADVSQSFLGSHLTLADHQISSYVSSLKQQLIKFPKN